MEFILYLDFNEFYIPQMASNRGFKLFPIRKDLANVYANDSEVMFIVMSGEDSSRKEMRRCRLLSEGMTE